MKKLHWLIVFVAGLFAGVALAEQTYYNAALQPMVGVVGHFLNTSGQAIPISTNNPLP